MPKKWRLSLPKSDLVYAQPDEQAAKELLSLASGHAGLTEVYTYLSLYPSPEPNSRLWTASDPEGLKLVLYDGGSYTVRCFPADGTVTAAVSRRGDSVFDIPKKRRLLTAMTGGALPSAATENVRELDSKQIREAFYLFSGTRDLPDYLEKRYVESLRAVNRGLSFYTGVFENGELVSCAGVIASNRRYALIGNVFTREDRRGRGYGSAAVTAVVNSAADKGLIPILYCEKKNVPFYRRLCFRETVIPTERSRHAL